MFRSCKKSVDIKKLNKTNVVWVTTVDSLSNVIEIQKQKIDSFPEVMREDRLNIHMEYDDFISKRDRGEQLMELHMIVKSNIKKLQR